MKRFKFSDIQTNNELYEQCLARPKMDIKSVNAIVEPIIQDVFEKGDEALNFYANKFDKAVPKTICINPNELEVNLKKEVKEAIDLAYTNIYKFHQAQKQAPLMVETMPGVKCQRVTRPIEAVGLYVPGGTAILPSTSLMLGVPAQIAGCKTIVVTTPPNEKGLAPDEVIYVAQKIGATHLLLAGGAQAVAALAYGTQTVPKVDKIFGPGNQFVTAAKMILQNSDAKISIDMPAGPSEVLVIADDKADPAFVAIDLLSQAEHGIDSQVVLVTIGNTDIDAIESEIDRLLNQIERSEIAKKALENSFIIQTDTVEQAFEYSNKYAPEHLILQFEEADNYLTLIDNAGSVFVGAWTPESVGDYASGTNHTLPTYGYARMYSGVNLADYQKFITIQQLSEEGIKNIGPAVETLAACESLDAHRLAVSLRLQKLNKA